VTSHGTYHADRAILAVGPWLPQMANGARLPLVVERQLSHWFMPLVTDGSCSADTCPLGLWEPSADHLFLTTPDIGQGVKCGGHHDGFSTTPESVHREVSDEENAGAHAFLERVMPGAAGPLREARVCLYTNTPDQHFLIDWHPDAPRVLLASPCSGHGFKFSSAIGEILADLASGALPQFDLSPFSLARFR
jgi:sarcosine oxidase